MRQPPPPAPADELAADHASYARCVAWVRDRAADPVLGLFGPESVAWTMVRGWRVDWYPYAFLDVPRLGMAEVLTNIAILVSAVPLLGLVLMGIERLLGARH